MGAWFLEVAQYQLVSILSALPKECQIYRENLWSYNNTNIVADNGILPTALYDLTTKEFYKQIRYSNSAANNYSSSIIYMYLNTTKPSPSIVV